MIRGFLGATTRLLLIIATMLLRSRGVSVKQWFFKAGAAS